MSFQLLFLYTFFKYCFTRSQGILQAGEKFVEDSSIITGRTWNRVARGRDRWHNKKDALSQQQIMIVNNDDDLISMT